MRKVHAMGLTNHCAESVLLRFTGFSRSASGLQFSKRRVADIPRMGQICVFYQMSIRDWYKRNSFMQIKLNL